MMVSSIKKHGIPGCHLHVGSDRLFLAAAASYGQNGLLAFQIFELNIAYL